MKTTGLGHRKKFKKYEKSPTKKNKKTKIKEIKLFFYFLLFGSIYIPFFTVQGTIFIYFYKENYPSIYVYISFCLEPGCLPGRRGHLLPDGGPHPKGRGAHRLVLQGVRRQTWLPFHRYN